jgi:hypothetical protein
MEVQTLPLALFLFFFFFFWALVKVTLVQGKALEDVFTNTESFHNIPYGAIQRFGAEQPTSQSAQKLSFKVLKTKL